MVGSAAVAADSHSSKEELVAAVAAMAEARTLLSDSSEAFVDNYCVPVVAVVVVVVAFFAFEAAADIDSR